MPRSLESFSCPLVWNGKLTRSDLWTQQQTREPRKSYSVRYQPNTNDSSSSQHTCTGEGPSSCVSSIARWRHNFEGRPSLPLRRQLSCLTLPPSPTSQSCLPLDQPEPPKTIEGLYYEENRNCPTTRDQSTPVSSALRRGRGFSVPRTATCACKSPLAGGPQPIGAS